jgi:hypothetical protein
MKAIKRFGLLWYEFVVGDDWTITPGVVLSVLATWFLARYVAVAWVVTPVAVALLLGGIPRTRPATLIIQEVAESPGDQPRRPPFVPVAS